MEQFLHLTFATTTDDARRHFLRDNGTFSLGMLRHMFADYVILGKLQSVEVWDISRNGMVKNVSEFKESLFSQNITSLGVWEAHLQHVLQRGHLRRRPPRQDPRLLVPLAVVMHISAFSNVSSPLE